ncbi:DUF5652 family protein [Candidatus Parcubacteria bacterium]|nr:DUF5652 family protein [Candidatus Parcubacteria bacterium]
MWNPLLGDPLVGPLVAGLGLGILFPFVFLLLIVWTFAWKAIALWHAARNRQRIWFVVLLLVPNTLGILEIIYLKWFEKNENKKGTTDLFPFIKDIRGKVSARMKASAPEEPGPV